MHEESKTTTTTTTSTSGGRRTVLAGLALAFIVAAGLFGASQVGFKPEGPDAWTYDWRTLLFSQSAPEPRKDIAIVLISEDSVAEYDYISPTDRGMLARLVRALDEAKPKAIGLDFFFDRKSDPVKTAELIEAIKHARTPVVMGAIDKRAGFKPENLQFQEEFFKATGRTTAGHVFFARDLEKVKISEQVVRYIGHESPEAPHRKSFSAVLADLNGVRPEPQTPHIAWLLPPSGNDLFTVFRVPRHAPGSSLDTILPPSWRAALKDKYVLVGVDLPDRDRHLTPLSIWDGRKVPGVTIQAQILAQYLDGRSLRMMPWQAELAFLALAAFLGFLISAQWDSKKLDWVFYFAGIAILMMTGVAVFYAFALIIPTTFLFFAWTAGVTGAHYTKDVLRRIRVVVETKSLKGMVVKPAANGPASGNTAGTGSVTS